MLLLTPRGGRGRNLVAAAAQRAGGAHTQQRRGLVNKGVRERSRSPAKRNVFHVMGQRGGGRAVGRGSLVSVIKELCLPVCLSHHRSRSRPQSVAVCSVVSGVAQQPAVSR